EDVAELVRSLGGVTAVRVKKHVTYPYNGETRCGRDGYRVTVSLPHINPFWCARKASGYDPRPKRAADCKSIVAIEPDGERPCVCIAVDSVDQLYVTTGYTLTHNTCIFLQLLDEVLQDGQRALILAHRRELVMQPYERLGQFWPQRQQRAGIAMAHTTEPWAQSVIATVQTLPSETRLAQIQRGGPTDYLVLDESHQCPSTSYRRIIGALKH